MKTIGKKEIVNVESEKPKIVAVEEAESHKPVVAPKERNIDLQLLWGPVIKWLRHWIEIAAPLV